MAVKVSNPRLELDWTGSRKALGECTGSGRNRIERNGTDGATPSRSGGEIAIPGEHARVAWRAKFSQPKRVAIEPLIMP